MNIISWNIRDWGEGKKKGNKEILCKEKADIVVLQGTKMKKLTGGWWVAYGGLDLKSGHVYRRLVGRVGFL